jgi:hypothetical protein
VLHTSFGKRVKEYYQYFKSRWGRKAGIFLFFLCLSSIFWILKALDKSYNVLIRYPIVYSGSPEGKVLVGNPTTSVYLNVSARGYSLLRLQLFASRFPLNVNLRGRELIQANAADSSRFFMLSRLAADKLIKQSDVDMQILSVMPDTLFFTFTRKSEKKVSVVPSVSVEETNQFVLKRQPYSVPSEVLVSGPFYLVDTLRHIYTEHYVSRSNSEAMESKRLNLTPIYNLTYLQDKVMVNIEREKFTEKVITVPVSVQNIPDSLDVKTFPMTIQITCHVGLSHYHNVSPSEFMVVGDYKSLIHNEKKLQLHITAFPSYIQIVDFKPHSVDYIIERW